MKLYVELQDDQEQKPKVLFVTRKFPPSVGGMENFAYGLNSSINKICDVRTISWGGKNVWLPLVIPYIFLRSFFSLLFMQVDVVHAQDGIMTLLLLPLAKLYQKPFVSVIHGLDITFDNKFYQKLIPWAVSKADKVICISSAAAEETVKRGVNPENVHVIPPGYSEVPSQKLSKDEAIKKLENFLKRDLGQKRFILNVGRLVERKGINWFIENVMTELVVQYPNLVFLVIGDGESREQINQIIKALSLQDNVLLLGRTNDDLLEAAYVVSEIFVMPNIQVAGDMEGFGLVLLEASLRNKPIVASALEGILEATSNGDNAIHVASKDEAGFIKHISYLLDNPDEAAAKGQKAHLYTKQNYAWPVLAQKYLKCYNEIKQGTNDRIKFQ